MAVSARKSSIVFTPARGLATLLAGAAVMALPGLAQAQMRERMDHDIAENGGRDREPGPRPQRGWGGDNNGGETMQRGRPAFPQAQQAPAQQPQVRQAPVQQEWRRPAQGWNQSAPPPPPPPVAQSTPRQQGWDGQRWNGQNWDGRNRGDENRRDPNQGSQNPGWNNPGWQNRGDDRPRQWNGDPRQNGQWGNRDNDRRWDGQRRGDDDRRWNGNPGWSDNRGWDRNRAPDWSNRRESWSSRSDRDWNREWRRDRRYDWRGWRSDHRDVYRLGRYYPPYRAYTYRRLGIGFYLESGFFGTSYWLNDPWAYRLPPAYGPYRWVRYYDDAVMVNIYTGQVVDVIYDFFW